MATQVAPLPQPPTGFGLNNLPIGTAFGPEGNWGPMFNNSLNTCVEALAIHTIQHWTYAATGAMAPFVDADGRSLYSDWTGYAIGNPATDLGTQDYLALGLWILNGITDDNSVNHKLAAYYELPFGDVDALAQAAYLCGAVYVNVNLPVIWDNALILSGLFGALTSPAMTGARHTIPVIGRSTNGNFICPTFGGLVQMTPAGYQQFVNISFALISDDWIDPDTGTAPNGYTLAQIEQYMNAIRAHNPVIAVFGGRGTLSATVGKIKDSVPASLTGTGTLSATIGKIKDSVPAALSGSGTLSAAIGVGAAASLTGVGTLSATAVKTSDSAAASLAGAGTLSVAMGVGASAAFSGAGTLSAAVYSDPFWANVVALLHCDGTNGSTTFTDVSPLAANFTVVSSTPTISTTQSEFGGASLNMPGATVQVGASAASSNFAFGTADFTVECWVWGSSFSGTESIWDQRPNGVNGLYPTLYLSAGVPKYFTNSADRITASGALSTSAWHHIAVSRVSGSTRLFVDGTQAGSTFTDSNNYLNGGTNRPMLGNSSSSGLGLIGFIDEVRITRAGRYSANFTAPTAPFPQG